MDNAIHGVKVNNTPYNIDYNYLINKPFGEEVREIVVEWDDGDINNGGTWEGKEYALKLGEKYVLTSGDQEYIYQAYDFNRFVSTSNIDYMDNMEIDSKVMQEPSKIILLPIDTHIIPQDPEDFGDYVANLDFKCEFLSQYEQLSIRNQKVVDDTPAGKLEHITYKKIEPKYIPYHTQLRRKIIDNLYLDESTDVSGDKSQLQKNVVIVFGDWPYLDRELIFFLPGVTYEIKIDNRIYYTKCANSNIDYPSLEADPLAISLDLIQRTPDEKLQYKFTITGLDNIPEIQLPINLSITEIWEQNTGLTPLYTLEYSPNELYEEERQEGSLGPIVDINKAILELQGAIHDILEYLYEKEVDVPAKINNSGTYLKPYFKYTDLSSYSEDSPFSNLDSTQFGATLYKTIKELQNFLDPGEPQE